MSSDRSPRTEKGLATATEERLRGGFLDRNFADLVRTRHASEDPAPDKLSKDSFENALISVERILA